MTPEPHPAEPSDEFALPITEKGVVRLTPRLRETYHEDTVEESVVQAVGYSVRIWIWSDRENVCIELPLDGYRVERPYQRPIYRWGVNLGRYQTPGKSNDDGENTQWNNRGALEVGYGSESGKEMVEATVTTFEGVMPRGL